MRPSSPFPSFYALLATLFLICFDTSSALPTSGSSDSKLLQSIPTLRSRSLDNWYQCYDSPGAMQRRAKYNDCARAAAQLPNFIEEKTFHRGGDGNTDPYALPIIKRHNTCQITVDVRFGRSDVSSWVGIDMALSKIMEACSVGYGQHETTGGEIEAGLASFILVTVGKPGAAGRGAAAAVVATS
ncbi:MAG: hypothetical protein LQ348_005295 [Seirophora lacunosa]|nr:MAG: hypothetical protein LQ348_005295 [Seirophora lacunosa]